MLAPVLTMASTSRQRMASAKTFLSPALMSAGVQVHPLLVLFGVLCGAEIAGVPGIFFSVPVIAALRLIVVRLRRRSSAT